jgi:5-methylcytosine-specific restriction endonuclease McrA
MQAEQPELDVIEREAPSQPYAAFLRSREWSEIRQLVLQRAGGLCEACRKREPVIVHHLTYRYGFKPPLWCLKALCRVCHSRFKKGLRRDPWMGKSGYDN